MIRQELKRLFSNPFVKIASLALFVVLGLVFYQSRLQQDPEPSSALLTDRAAITEAIRINQDRLSLDLYQDHERQAMEAENAFYQKLLAVAPQPLNQASLQGLLEATRIAYLLVLVFAFILAFYLWIQDENNHFKPLYRTLPRTPANLFTCKFLALSTVLVLVFALVWILQCLTMDPNPAIQNIGVLRSSILFVDLRAYLLVQAAWPLLAILALVLFFLNLYQLTRRMGLALGLLTGFFLFEYLAHRFIPPPSPLAGFKYINLFHLSSLEMTAYRPVFILNTYRQAFSLNVLALLLALAFNLVLAVKTYDYPGILGTETASKGLNCTSPSLWGQQVFQILIVHRGLLVLCCLVLFGLYQALTFEVAESQRDRQIAAIKAEFYGPLDEALDRKLGDREADYQAARTKLDRLHQKLYDQEDLTPEELESLEAASQKYQSYQAFKEVQREIQSHKLAGYSHYADTTGYKLLIGWPSPYPLILRSLLLTLALSLLVARSVSHQYEIPIRDLYHSSYLGKQNLGRINRALFTLISITMSLIMLGLHIFKIGRFYPDIFRPISIDNVLPTQISLDIWPLILWTLINSLVFLLAILSLTAFLAQRLGLLVSLAQTVLAYLCGLGLLMISPQSSPLILITPSFILYKGAYLFHLCLSLALGGFLMKASQR